MFSQTGMSIITRVCVSEKTNILTFSQLLEICVEELGLLAPIWSKENTMCDRVAMLEKG